MALFNIALSDLDINDVIALIERGASESDNVEFKQDLPSRTVDPWHSGGSIGERARNKLLEEVVAFANSLGGTLVLGMEETDDSPPRAWRLNPLPRCAELAMRLDQAAGSVIEPQIPSLKFRGIVVDESGMGVVVAEVQRSHLAPHRLKSTRECYTRRGERTELMTMREIRDLVLTTRDLTGHLESQFQAQRDSFVREHTSRAADTLRSIRVTAVPLDPDRIYIDAQRMFSTAGEELRSAGATLPDGSATIVSANLPRSYLSWRPMLRGVIGWNNDEAFSIQLELHNNGVVNLTAYLSDGESDNRVYASWFSGAVLSPILYASRIRSEVNEAGVEFGVEVELRSDESSPAILVGWGNIGETGVSPTRFTSGQVLFPRYRFGHEVGDVLNQFIRDMWNSVGQGGYSEDLTWHLAVD